MKWTLQRPADLQIRLVSGCINKMEHFHPSCRRTGSIRHSYPAQGILLKQRNFQGADLDITSAEINHDWILSSTNTHSMPVFLSLRPQTRVSTLLFPKSLYSKSSQSVQPSLVLNILMITQGGLSLTWQQCVGKCCFRGLSKSTNSYPVREDSQTKHNSLWLMLIKALIQNDKTIKTKKIWHFLM